MKAIETTIDPTDENREYLPPPSEHPTEPVSLTGTFLSTTSHEIRTALNGIVGMAQVMADTSLSAEQQNCVDTILKSTSGLLNTINYALDISRIESGQMELQETICDLRAMCDTLFRRHRPLARKKGLEFSCECHRNVPISVLCDEKLVDRILGYLLQNALQNTSQGSVSLYIDCHQKTPQGAELTIQVIDSSSGNGDFIPNDLSENALTNKAAPPAELHKKTGMDFEICKKLIKLMGGTIDMASTVGKGAICNVGLTLCQANRPAPIHLGGESRIKTINPNTRILLAEDNKLNQKAIASILRKAGCEIDIVDDGDAAVRKVNTNEYDIILMDCQMPVLDGYEATARIRAEEDNTQPIPIIALTANVMKGDRRKCMECGMDGYLPKPVEKQDLIDSINKFARTT